MILFSLVVAALLFALACRDNEPLGMKVVLPIVGLIMGGMLGWVSAFCFGSTFPTEYVLMEEIELVALQDNKMISGNFAGNFMLAYGNIRSEFFYLFYVRDKNGEIRFRKRQADDQTSILEEERKNGVLKIYELVFVEAKSYYWGFMDTRAKKYVFHVPVGSLIKSFKLDLEG
jgi:hypothetical protein